MSKLPTDFSTVGDYLDWLASDEATNERRHVLGKILQKNIDAINQALGEPEESAEDLIARLDRAQREADISARMEGIERDQVLRIGGAEIPCRKVDGRYQIINKATGEWVDM